MALRYGCTTGGITLEQMIKARKDGMKNKEKVMKFRIVKYYERYKPQAFICEEYMDIGSPTGYHSIEDAENYCKQYKAAMEDNIVKEFEL